MSEITRMLAEFRKTGTPSDELVGLIYKELRQLARAHVKYEKSSAYLQATELVHEAYLRLFNHDHPAWESRRHFFGAASEVMRRVLVDQARQKLAKKRGGEWQQVHCDELFISAKQESEEVLRLHEAITALSAADPDAAELVKLRYFVRLTINESADLLDVSVRTANRMWKYARAFLKHEMNGDDQEFDGES